MAGRGEVDAEADALDSSSPATIKVIVKFSGRTIPLTVSPQSTVGNLKSLLLPLTNVLIRGQKLIFKGRVLIDAMTLGQSEILNGSKVMLIASEGLHQGIEMQKRMPTSSSTNWKHPHDFEMQKRMPTSSSTNWKHPHDFEKCDQSTIIMEQDGPIKGSTLPNLRRVTDTSHVQQNKISASVGKGRLEDWKKTGVVALSGCLLMVVPEEIWVCGPQIRALDVSHNNITEIPREISSLKSLSRVFLDSNNLTSESISWEGLSSLKFLLVLSFNHNKLTFLPSEIGSLTSLKKLDVAYNKLTHLPEELGLLRELQICLARNNMISSITSCMGNCSSLIEVDFSSNLLKELPETFGNLRKLKALDLSNNGIKSLPSSIFKMCSELSALNLHGTEITNNVLRQIEGWEDFDERRRKKYEKQLDFRVGYSGGFDEGADQSGRH